MNPIESEENIPSFGRRSRKVMARMLRILLGVMLLILPSEVGNAADRVSYSAADTITPPKEPLELMPTTPISNIGDCTEIGFSIKCANEPFTIYDVEWINHGEVKTPVEPFRFTARTDEPAGRPIIWSFLLEFPYSTHFGGNDSVSIHTDKGTLVFLMNREEMLRRRLAKAKTQLTAEKDRSASRRRNVWIAVGIAVGLLGGSAGVVWWRMRGRFVREDREIEELSMLASERSERNSELESKVDALYGERLAILNLLCNEYFEKHDSDRLRISFCREVERHILALRDSGSQVKLEETVNTYQDNIMGRLRNQLPGLSQKDLVFLTYIYAGFSLRAICVFTDIKPKSFYSRRARLRERILASDAPDKDYFIAKMKL